MDGKRKAVIEKGVTMKINTGNFENIEIYECLKTEIEFDTPGELEQKNMALTQKVLGQVQASAEAAMKKLNRQRVVDQQPAELW